MAAAVPPPCVGFGVEGVEDCLEEERKKRELLTQDSGREMSRHELPKTEKTMIQKSNRSAFSTTIQASAQLDSVEPQQDRQ
jgi:hypothetical protein